MYSTAEVGEGTRRVVGGREGSFEWWLGKKGEVGRRLS